MGRASEIVDLINVGLQTAEPDPTFGEVSPVNRDECWRCSQPSEGESGLCGGCRSFLLEDTDEDPKQRRVTFTIHSEARREVWNHLGTDAVMRSWFAQHMEGGYGTLFLGGPLNGSRRTVEDPSVPYRVVLPERIDYISAMVDPSPIAPSFRVGEYQPRRTSDGRRVFVYQGER